MAETKDKTGVFTGAYAINPVNNEQIPIYIADYVLMGYGTGAIMAVPGHDERDCEFAKKFDLPISRYGAAGRTVMDRTIALSSTTASAINTPIINGLPTERGEGEDHRHASRRKATASRSVKYKLRDWLFSRQRYWGEPFPILLDEDGKPHALRRRSSCR